MWTDGRIRDWCGHVVFEGDEYTVYYCWTPVNDPNSLDIEPNQIPSKTDIPFYEIYRRGHNKALHKTFNKPTDNDFLAAKNNAQNSFPLHGMILFCALLILWLYIMH